MTTTSYPLEPGERCPWTILVASGHPEPDSPADTVREVACGAALHPDPPDGAVCDAGHQFGNLARRYAPFGEEWEREQADRYEGGW
jgi:hypothetical protein